MAQVYGARWAVQEDAMDGSLQAEWGCHMILVLAVPLTGVLYGMSFNLSDMERGELCHDQLTDRMQDIGRQPSRTRKRDSQALCIQLRGLVTSE